MKHGPLTKLDKRNMTGSKTSTIIPCQQIKISLFFQFMANLEQYGSGILHTLSMIIKFSLIRTFNLTKT